METRNGLVYMLFAQEVGPMVKSRYPLVGKVQYNQILGQIWKGMPETDRVKYQRKADTMNLAQNISLQQMVQKPTIDDMVITPDISKQIVTKPEPQGPTLTTNLVSAINDPNIKSTNHAVNNSNQRAFTAFSAAVRPSLERQNPRMRNEQINQLLEQNWNQLGEDERYKYSKVAKPRLGDYFGKFRAVELYKNKKSEKQEKEVIDLEDEGSNTPATKTLHPKKSEADEDIRIIKENTTHPKSSNKEEITLENDDIGMEEDVKENLEVLYPSISITPPEPGADGECGGCEGLEKEVSGLKRELTDKSEVIARLVKRIRYLEDVTEYKY